MNIKKGDVVTINPDWLDDGDDTIVFIAVENEDGGRVLIEAQIGFTHNPRQIVTVDMLAIPS